MKKSAYYSDLIFLFSFLLFCGVFVLRFFGVPLLFSLVLSAIPATFGSYLLSLHYKKKQKIFALKKSEEVEKADLFFYLCLAPTQEKFAFLRPALRVFSSSLQDDEKSFDKQDVPDDVPSSTSKEETTAEPPFLFHAQYAFLPVFKFREISADDVGALYPVFKDEQFPVLLCDKISDEGKDLCTKLSVRLIDGPLFYRLLKDAELIPSEYPVKIAPPIKRSRRRISFSKSNSRRFFSAGATLLFCSLFIPYPVYYLIFGGLFLVLSLIVRVFGYR
jgi:hypothetical protein